MFELNGVVFKLEPGGTIDQGSYTGLDFFIEVHAEYVEGIKPSTD